MAYDEGVAQRIRDVFDTQVDYVEKKMFGGLCFMVFGHMCCGVQGDILMARVGADQYETALQKNYSRKMTFTGKPLKGFVYVDPEGFAEDDDLISWITTCQQFVATLPAKKEKKDR